jgi:polyhydroxyalkanoate synthesis regulator phasin
VTGVGAIEATEEQDVPAAVVATTTTRARSSTTTTQRSITIVQNASSDADVAALRRELDALKSEVASLRQRVDAQSTATTTRPYDPTPMDQRVTELERQVGVHSINRKGLTTIWDELSDLRNCMKYQSSYC